MPEPGATVTTFDEYTAALVAGCQACEDVTGLVLAGSATRAGAHLRDEWSDHDFYCFVRDGCGERVRAAMPFLPFPDRVAVVARERIGATVLYADGQVFEYAVGTAAEITPPAVGLVEVAYGSAPALPEPATTAADVVSAEDELALALVKLLIGVGRSRRGEILSGGQFVRTWAVNHLLRAARLRSGGGEPLDSARRFEQAAPELAAALAVAVAQPVEPAARGVFEAALTLAPGWPGFPQAAAEVVARRLGWTLPR